MSRCNQFLVAGLLLLVSISPRFTCAHGAEPSTETDSVPRADEEQLPAKLERLELDKYCLQISEAYHQWQAGHPALARRVLDETDPRYRGWAYDHLSYRFGQELRSITALEQHIDGAKRGVRHVAFSPDGKQLAAACDDLRVKVYDSDSGEKRLDFHRETRTIDFSPEGKTIFGGSSTFVIGTDAATGKTARTFSTRSGIAGIPLRVECSSDGKYVAATDSHRGVRVWNVESGKCDHHFEEVAGLCRLTPDGSRLAVVDQWFDEELGQRQAEIVLRDLETGEQRPPALRYRLPMLGISAMAFSPDGQQLAAACWTTAGEGAVIVFDVATGDVRYELQGHTQRVASVAYSPDGQRMATAGVDQTIRLWDTHTGRMQFVLRGHTGLISAVAFHPDGLQLASSSDDGQVKLWDLTAPPEGYAYLGMDIAPRQIGEVLAVAGERLVTLGQFYDETLQESAACLHVRFSRTSAVQKQVMLSVRTTVYHAALSGDGSFLAASTVEATSADWKSIRHRLRVWDLAGERPIVVLERDVDGPRSVAFSPDEKQLAILSVVRQPGEPWQTDVEIELVESQMGQHLHTEKSRMDGAWEANSLVFSPNGRQVAATFSATKAINHWEGATIVLRTDTGKRLAVLEEPRGIVRQAAFSQDGNSIVTAVDRRDQAPHGLIEVWNLKRQEHSLSIEAHAMRTEDVAFSPCGKLIVSAGGEDSRNGQVRLWRADTGQPLLQFDLSNASRIVRLAFIGPDHCLFTLDGHGTVRLLESKTPSPEVRFERAAVARTLELASRTLQKWPLLAAEKRERLTALPLHDEVRRRALALWEYTPDNPQMLLDWSWRVSLRTDGSEDRYQRALQLAKLAGKQEPKAARPRMVQSLAEYRLQKYEQSWETLGKADDLSEDGPANLSLRAMLQHQLGQREAAVKSLTVVQQAVQERQRLNPNARQLFAEAQQTVESD